jgi:hypothetical protein
MTVRIAFSLGMHRNIRPTNVDSVSRARLHRLWWTIYLLDQEIAIQLGYPCAIIDNVACIQTPQACESILDPGRTTPLGYQAVCISLIRLNKKISHTLYVSPAFSTRKVPFPAVTGCIGDLRDWFAQLPPHLFWSAGMTPSHRRAIAVLHLRYWTTMIHVQRPFLLYTVTRGEELEGDKKRWYEELSHSCLEAAEKSVVILRQMRDHGVLSSLVLFDSQCIQELVQVFLLGKQYAGAETTTTVPLPPSDGLETCIAAMKGMEAVGWCEKILPELLAQVAARNLGPGSQQADKEHVERVAAGSMDGTGSERATNAVSRTLENVGGTTTFQAMNGVSNETFFENFQDFE